VTGLDSNPRSAGFTLVEMLATLAVFGVFMTGLLTTWTSLSYTGLNTTAFAARQGDEVRVLDYVKRDIRRATAVAIYNGATLVSDTTTFGSELRLTMPGYYSDTREEDNAIGTKITNAPTAAAGAVTYGAPFTVRYYTTGGAVIRDEAGTLRTIANAAGAFALSFKAETSSAIRCRVFFDQPMRGGTARTLRRQVDNLCVPRFQFQL
jgi:prepilin-type N-terminal cleavage/methylation domain-containing protein